MAERRMFAKAIVSAGKFLRMPPTARLLYYDLGMSADDDGVVEAFSVMTQTRATEDDLRVLIAKGYIKILTEDLVAYICDWNRNNSIRADRYHPGIYHDLIVQFNEQETMLQIDNQVTTNCQPSDNQTDTEVRLGKVSLDKDSKEKNNIEKPKKPKKAKPPKKPHGEFENVFLTDEELEKLKVRFPDDWEDRIETLSDYMPSHGVSYNDHYATILNWARQDAKREAEKAKREAELAKQKDEQAKQKPKAPGKFYVTDDIDLSIFEE